MFYKRKSLSLFGLTNRNNLQQAKELNNMHLQSDLSEIYKDEWS